MRRILAYFGIFMLVACSSDIDQSELAVQAAKAYYDQMLHGDYASFVAGTDGYDSISQNYREQLETNMKMFIGQQKTEHKGIDSVIAVRANVDTIKANGKQIVVANAFLALCYGDSTREEVVVPMVDKDGVWKMK